MCNAHSRAKSASADDLFSVCCVVFPVFSDIFIGTRQTFKWYNYSITNTRSHF